MGDTPLVYIDLETKRGLYELAKKNDRTMSAQIRHMVKQALSTEPRLTQDKPEPK